MTFIATSRNPFRTLKKSVVFDNDLTFYLCQSGRLYRATTETVLTLEVLTSITEIIDIQKLRHEQNEIILIFSCSKKNQQITLSFYTIDFKKSLKAIRLKKPYQRCVNGFLLQGKYWFLLENNNVTYVYSLCLKTFSIYEKKLRSIHTVGEQHPIADHLTCFTYYQDKQETLLLFGTARRGTIEIYTLQEPLNIAYVKSHTFSKNPIHFQQLDNCNGIVFVKSTSHRSFQLEIIGRHIVDNEIAIARFARYYYRHKDWMLFADFTQHLEADLMPYQLESHTMVLYNIKEHKYTLLSRQSSSNNFSLTVSINIDETPHLKIVESNLSTNQQFVLGYDTLSNIMGSLKPVTIKPN